MFKVVSFTICPFVQRVTALLEAKGLPYDVEYISLKDKPEWFLALSPQGQVPLLITETGDALFESDAIVEYIEEISAPLERHVTPEQRAKDRAWSYAATKHYLSQCSAMRSPSQDVLTERSEKLERAFEKVEKTLGDGPFFKGESLSIVDIAWLPLLHRAEIIKRHTGHDFLRGFEKMKSWQAALLATALPMRSVSADFEKRFVDFYLSEKTFLGQEKTTSDHSSLCRVENDTCTQHACC